MLKNTILIAILVLTGCTTANVGKQAEVNQTQHVTMLRAIDDAYTDAIQVASSMRWNITHSEKAAYLVQATTPGTPLRWQDEVSVTLAAVGDSTKITVRSKLGQEPNRKHVAEYLKKVTGAR